MSATPNPSQVMSTLRMLGDKELAQYASMHKKDPYIFPLAFQESNLRKQMRAQGAAGAAPQGPQPPVNDQALQTMAPQPLPEDVGLGRIAPPGVANMAGGGIVGFADGGEPWVTQKIQEAAAFVRANGGSLAKKLAEAGIDIASIPSNTLQRMIAPITGQMDRMAGNPTRIPGAIPGAQAAPRNEDYGNEGLRAGAGGPDAPFDRITGAADATPAIAPVPEAKPGVPPAAGGLGALSMGAGTSMSFGQRGGDVGGVAISPPTAAPVRTATDFNAMFDKAAVGAKIDPFADETRGVVEAENAAAKTRLEGQQGIATEQGKLYDKQEGRLNERSAGLEKEGKRNEAMSWITAGLEMMQARGPGLSAIAGGAQKGFTQYAAGLEKLKAAQERIDEAADKVAEARLGSKKEQLAAQSEYDKALVAGKRETLNSVRTAFDTNTKKAQKLVELQAQESNTDRQLASSEYNAAEGRRTTEKVAAGNNATTLRAAQIQAAAARASSSRNAQLEIINALQADPQKLATYQAMHAKNPNIMDGFTDWLKANPGAAMSKDGGLGQYIGAQAALTMAGQAMKVTNAAPAAGVMAR